MSPIAELQKEQPQISASDKAIIKSLHKGTLHHPNESFVERFRHRVTTGGALWSRDLGVARRYRKVRV